MSNDKKQGFGEGGYKLMRDMGNGSHAEVVATVLLTHDTTRTYFFNLESLPVSARSYDATTGRLTSETRGPDRDGFSYKMTYGYNAEGRITTESGWVKQ